MVTQIDALLAMRAAGNTSNRLPLDAIRFDCVCCVLMCLFIYFRRRPLRCELVGDIESTNNNNNNANNVGKSSTAIESQPAHRIVGSLKKKKSNFCSFIYNQSTNDIVLIEPLAAVSTISQFVTSRFAPANVLEINQFLVLFANVFVLFV